MRAVMVMFDSLNRRMLPPYGCEWTHAPNFARLAGRSVTFDNCYAGSMPCMPARRELHTARHNFLHRGWGPLEPFDDSMPEMLRRNGIYTHLATDHPHYWEDGGATYHGRYSSFEFFRGQEGDTWKGHVARPAEDDDLEGLRYELRSQNQVNRQYFEDEADHPQTLTVNAGLEFMAHNRTADRWFLQIETFDPHEPFFSYADYEKYYDNGYNGPQFDWPDYKRVDEPPEQVERARDEYAALLSMCDGSLGRVLDRFDEWELWDDTLLIVCTDHGFLLGEHGWWGKNVQPWYDETIHTPLFVWDPRTGHRGERRSALVQTIDLGPTLLEFFDVDRAVDMQGAPLVEVISSDAPVREAALFGIFGGHACVTDGRYVYMRACVDVANEPLYEYTLMPTHMRGFFELSDLRQTELTAPFEFSKGLRLLRVPGRAVSSPHTFGSLLFDLETDPDQHHPFVDDVLESRLATALRDLFVAVDAPEDQYVRLGLPRTGPINEEHLLVRKQWDQVVASTLAAPDPASFPATDPGATSPLSTLWEDPRGLAALVRHAPLLVRRPASLGDGAASALSITTAVPGLLPEEALRGLVAELAGEPNSAGRREPSPPGERG